MALTTKFNDGTKGQANTPMSVADHQAEVDAEAQKRRERDIADLAAESAGMENGRMKRFRPGTEAALRAEQARQGTDGRMTAAATAMLTAEAWDRQLVTVGGVTMTNAERQAARKRILDNPDQSLQWLRERNLLKAGEEQDFLRALRSEMEIDEIRRANGGRATPELEDQSRRNRARFGHAMDGAIGQSHRLWKASPDATAEQVGSTTTRSESTDQLHDAYDTHIGAASDEGKMPPAAEFTTAMLSSREEAYALHASAPVLADAFVMAKAATVPLDQAPEQAPAPADPTVVGTGLNF